MWQKRNKVRTILFDLMISVVKSILRDISTQTLGISVTPSVWKRTRWPCNQGSVKWRLEHVTSHSLKEAASVVLARLFQMTPIYVLSGDKERDAWRLSPGSPVRPVIVILRSLSFLPLRVQDGYIRRIDKVSPVCRRGCDKTQALNDGLKMGMEEAWFRKNPNCALNECSWFHYYFLDFACVWWVLRFD